MVTESSAPIPNASREWITVRVTTTMATEVWDVPLPCDVPVGRILQKMLSSREMAIRTTDEVGNQISYRILWKEGGRHLLESEKLDEVGVKDGHLLILTNQPSAGAHGEMLEEDDPALVQSTEPASPREMPEADNFEFSPRKRQMAKDSPKEVPYHLSAQTSPFTLYVTDVVLNGIRAYVGEHSDVEVGGVLVGRRYSGDARSVVEIDDFRTLPSADTSAVHFTFDRMALLELHNSLDHAAESYVVGWFHSHPRMGDPFMSSTDLTLHDQHFSEPWYVSCVVAAGEWALPAGFWRMVAGHLVSIDDYFVHMTRSNRVGGQSRRLLEACLAGQGASTGEDGLTALLTDLDFLPEVSELARVLHQDPDGRGFPIPRTKDLVSELRRILGLSMELARRPELAEENERLRRTLRSVRTLNGDLALVAKIEDDGDRACVHDGVGCVTGSDGLVLIVDFTSTARVRFEAVPLHAAFAPDGTLWFLADDLKLTGLTRETRLTLSRDLRFSARLLQTQHGIDVEPEPLEFVAGHGEFWLRGPQEISGYSILPPDDAKAGRLQRTCSSPLPCSECVLIKASDHETLEVLGVSGGCLVRWDVTGRELGRCKLPRQWCDWQLVQACSVQAGIFALFDDGRHGQVGRWDWQCSQLVTHYIQELGAEKRRPLKSICRDSQGRVFLLAGPFLYLLAVSGVRSSEWYWQRVSSLRS